MSENKNLKSITEIKAALAAPIPAELIRTREAGRDRNGEMRYAEYVNVNDYKDLLDKRAGIWEATVVDFKQVSESMTCVVRIAIHAADGVYNQDGTGMEALNGNGYGDPFSNAYSQAFRRACEGHGLSRELWRKDAGHAAHQAAASTQAPQHRVDYASGNRPANGSGSFNGDPVARSLSDLVTTKQLGMIRALSREKLVDADNECFAVLKCKTGELSRKAASTFIEHLQGLSAQRATAPLRPNSPPQPPPPAPPQTRPQEQAHYSGPGDDDDIPF